MARSPSPSPERLALLAAHEARAAAQTSLAEAEAVYREMLTTWSAASHDADGLETQVKRLQDRRDPGINQLRWQYAEQVDAARAALNTEVERIQPIKDAYDVARDRIPEAERALDAAQAQVKFAARHVVAAEAAPVARAAMAQLREAHAAVLDAAPDLWVLVEKGILPSDMIHLPELASDGLLRRIAGSPEMAQRTHSSGWRTALERLQDDPQAALPQARTS